MTDARRDPSSYAREVAETTRKYLDDLRAENDELRNLTGLLKEEKQRLEIELERQLSSRNELAQKLDGIQAQHLRLTNRYVQVERQTTGLAQLYVASARLHEHPERKQVLLAIEEIVSGIIGSEQFGVYELKADRNLTLISSMGIDQAALATIPRGRGFLGKVVEQGQTWVVKPGEAVDELPTLTVCIPLMLGQTLVGAIAIFELLPQKAVFLDSDFRLFELLANQAALALYFSGLHERSGHQP